VPHLWQVFTEAGARGRSLYLPMQDDRALTLAEILERAERTAADVLARLDGRVPRRLGVLMNNGEPWVRGALSAFRLDAAIVPLPLPVGFAGADAYRAHLGRIVQSAQLDAILIDSSLGAGITRRITGDLVDTPFIDITEPGDGTLTDATPAPTDATDSLAVIQYTSGSTSAPKGVALTHANVATGLNAVTSGLGWNDEDAFGVWIPMFHDMGLFSVLSGLARGTSVCLWRPTDFVRRPLTWLTSFAQSVATVMPAPNFCYDLLVAAARREPPTDLDLSSWRVASNGAEPVQRRTLEAFQETFAPYGLRPSTMNAVYGMAEATLVVTASDTAGHWRSLSVDRDELRAGSAIRPLSEQDERSRAVVCCGPAAPGIRLRVAAGDNGAADEGVVGEVQITGPAVTAGYLGLPAAEQPFTADGWLRTGDLGFLRDEELYIVGRIKDMITVRGQNFYAEDVEEIVRATAELARPGAEKPRSAAIPWTEGETERMVVLWETALDPAEADRLARTACERVRQQLGLDEVDVVPVPPTTIPHTTSGKVQRRAALGLYRAKKG
jgi:acyl-CoA synthetase (AMP-forming)/AMP-acid ligase II